MRGELPEKGGGACYNFPFAHTSLFTVQPFPFISSLLPPTGVLIGTKALLGTVDPRDVLYNTACSYTNVYIFIALTIPSPETSGERENISPFKRNKKGRSHLVAKLLIQHPLLYCGHIKLAFVTT
ncbi:hypothetical protein, unlikely [Trypanosoma brucei gambiense DAL972]|uniref:Uncharacterized protein n=1 Tax=Trypanosoma brucei gambiense (strain MHOM/CI/86/DAL972) TaxID=679716 RepID=C9ZZ80_TRYB9|nr:hypothetical protein, unlikely [Trypanosoma brucei gambiense DAL972]CBH14729.1 hypothetical protein, unlikely [Trypanosoma brucei gambiense DAL972]|eukprot:XP_011776995.1 hypothetical protein, unlikely [Trypanosoma brucei gambiense DAL972]